MGSLYRRGKIWWIKYYVKGKAVRETSRSESKDDAQTLLRIREGDTARGVLIPGRIEFSQLVNDMMNEYWMHQKKSFRDVGYRVTKHVLPYFGTTMAQDITTATLNDYKLFRQDQKASNGTINRELAAIRRAFNLGIENGTVVVVPKFRMLPEGRPRKGFFAEEELITLCKHLTPALRPVVIFGFVTGWRKQEILGLEWRNIDFKAGEIRLEAGTTKNDEGRVFPMTPDLRELLTTQRKRTDAVERKLKQIIPLVFHRNGYRIKSFKKAWAIACEKAKLVGRYFHDFRRTASRNWAIKVGTHVAMQIVGHKTRYIFDRYRIVSKKDLQEVGKTRILKAKK